MGQNIDRQHLRPPVLAILLETIEGKILTDCLLSTKFVSISSSKKLHYTDTGYACCQSIFISFNTSAFVILTSCY